MTELEIMKRAKMYIDSLAQGIDPLTGNTLPDSDIVNNVRISRCFFYVSGVLGKVIDNGGEVQKKALKRSEKAPFYLSEEQLSSISPSAGEVNISTLVGVFNSNIDENIMKKLKTTDVTEWLLQTGFLTTETINDRKYKTTTAEGENIGISTELRQGQNGTYRAVLYNRSAQQFIIDNLPAIMEFAEQK